MDLQCQVSEKEDPRDRGLIKSVSEIRLLNGYRGCSMRI